MNKDDCSEDRLVKSNELYEWRMKLIPLHNSFPFSLLCFPILCLSLSRFLSHSPLNAGKLRGRFNIKWKLLIFFENKSENHAKSFANACGFRIIFSLSVADVVAARSNSFVIKCGTRGSRISLCVCVCVRTLYRPLERASHIMIV